MVTNNQHNYFKYILLALVVIGLLTPVYGQENNLSLTGTATSSSAVTGYEADQVTDGNNKTYWKSGDEDQSPWVIVRLPGATEVVRVGIKSGETGRVISGFKLQFMHNGAWKDVREISGNTKKNLIVELDEPV